MNYCVVDVEKRGFCDHMNTYVQIAWREAACRMEDDTMRIVVCVDTGWWCEASEFFHIRDVSTFKVIK